MTFAANPDFFTAGRDALAATKAAFAGQAFFASVRRLQPDASWSGPPAAVVALVDETALVKIGGLTAAKQQGASSVLCDSAAVAAQAEALGMRVFLRAPFTASEPVSDRDGRLVALSAIFARVPGIGGVLPVPLGEAQGLDTLQFFASCRAKFPQAHVIADVELLGTKLGQLCLSFGADELWGAISAQRALRLGEHASSHALTRDEAALLVRAAGFVPCERLAEGKVQVL
jgi:hypothetical protein